jgi:O-acetyl-ADP-ribose deacetylase (regulator of RNase III)
MRRVEVVRGDITKFEVDAIVNAANRSLLGGGGVDGAIHRAAGKELLAECRELQGCKIGQAKITRGYLLPAKYVIHTVGPVYRDGKHGEPADLYGCYSSSLKLATENGVKTIAFPCIGTGVFGYPFRQASSIALRAIADFLKGDEAIAKIWLVCFGERDFREYSELTQGLFARRVGQNSCGGLSQNLAKSPDRRHGDA